MSHNICKNTVIIVSLYNPHYELDIICRRLITNNILAVGKYSLKNMLGCGGMDEWMNDGSNMVWDNINNGGKKNNIFIYLLKKN